MASDLELADESIRALRAIVSSLLEGGDSKAESGVPGQRTASAWTGVWLAGGDAGTRAAAAETLARDLRKRLYRIDLRASAGRYIGETEKNLDRVLQAAGDVDVLLFVDEADELFGSRTDVKDAHDRYANIEVSYLLQRMERHSGVLIFGTNALRDPDPDLLRRLLYRVELPSPIPPK
jgi:SpoVK/Ycf46/Vps4 family AAA+-type ATPase